LNWSKLRKSLILGEITARIVIVGQILVWAEHPSMPDETIVEWQKVPAKNLTGHASNMVAVLEDADVVMVMARYFTPMIQLLPSTWELAGR
jgi:hypothetical protein